MIIKESLQVQGEWFFRWRSFFPLVLLPLFYLALRQGESISLQWGSLYEKIWEGIALAISYGGLEIRCWVTGYAPAGTSGRNTKKQCATELNTTGLYSVVRNPLYLGNFLLVFGVALLPEVWWFPVVLTLAYLLYYERIILVEEEFLERQFGEAFLRWAEKTPVCIPRLSGYVASKLPFSVRHILKREHTCLLVIGSAYAFAGIVHGDGWIVFGVVHWSLYLFLRGLKKWTTVLDLEGR